MDKKTLVEKLKERAKNEGRSCEVAKCEACPAHSPEGAGHPLCGWVSGLMLKEHSPTKAGIVLEAVELDTIGPVYSIREIKKGAGQTDMVLNIARTFAASGTPVFLAAENGVIQNMMGQPEALEKMKKVFRVADSDVEFS